MNSNRKLLMLPLIGILVLCGSAEAARIDASRYLEDVKQLASEELKGRGTGTPELDRAADYIAGRFQAAGLQPPDGKSYFQEFPVTTNARLGSGNRVRMWGGKDRTLKMNEDFLPFNFSASGSSSGTVVFAGYGITAREYGYDDYEGLDVKDKFVLILRHEPQEFDEKSVFAGRIYTEHSQFFSKASNAKLHGARGVILINDVAAHSDSDELEKFGATAGPGDAGIPFVQVKASAVRPWFEKAGKSLKEIQEGIDKDLDPRSFAFPAAVRVSMQIDLVREVKTVRNVAGLLPGETQEYVVVGAHYDHLGLGEQFSMAPSLAGTPHLGADDNASGTAGVIELARWWTARPKPKRSILFLAFAGEELGLLGSSYYVNHPLVPLDRAIAMFNMDMIGRVRDSKVFVGGGGTGSTFKSLIETVSSRHQLNLDLSESVGYGSSDHTSFTTKQVPVLFFFSGLHGDYHKPSDTWDKIDAPETARLLEFIADLTVQLTDSPERPQFVRVKEPRRAHAAGSTGSTGSGYGPYFGSIPDFAEVPNGVRFSDVRDGSPAAQAGLRGGDILVQFDGKPVQNLYDFTYALRAKKPGEEVAVRVLRDGTPLDVKVLLAERK